MKQFILVLLCAIVASMSCVEKDYCAINKELIRGAWHAEYELQKNDPRFWVVIPDRDRFNRDMTIVLDVEHNCASIWGFDIYKVLDNVPFRIHNNCVIFTNSVDVKPLMIPYYDIGDFLKYEFLEITNRDAKVRVWKIVNAKPELFMTAKLVKRNMPDYNN